jgi:predicted transcriptional regulator
VVKRNKLEIIRDILQTIKDSKNKIKITPLIRQSNLSSTRFKEYYSELIKKKFIIVQNDKSSKHITITAKGLEFLEKYKTIIGFIDEFGL